MSDREDLKRQKHIANATMQRAVSAEIRMNRTALSADVAEAKYDLNFATDLRMTFGVALKRAITELDRIGHDETEDTGIRMAALRMSGDLSARGLEVFAKLAQPEAPPAQSHAADEDAPRHAPPGVVITQEQAVEILRQRRLRLAGGA